MPCRSRVVRTTHAGGSVSLELRCSGQCADGSDCEPSLYTGTCPRDVILETCYCREEVVDGPPSCTPYDGAGQSTLRICRIALAYRRRPNGKPEERPFDVMCVGACPKGTICTPVVVGSTRRNGEQIEVLRCRCRRG
jgi:hypothetical protein